MRTSALFLAALLLPLAAAAQDWRGPVAVEVQVEDAKGRDLSGAEILLVYLSPEGGGSLPSVLTDASGKANIAGLAAGRWTLEVRHPGQMSFRAEILLSAASKPEVQSASHLMAPGATSTLKVNLARGRAGTAPATPAPAPAPVRPLAPPPAAATPPPNSSVAAPAPAVTPTPAPQPAPAPVTARATPPPAAPAADPPLARPAPAMPPPAAPVAAPAQVSPVQAPPSPRPAPTPQANAVPPAAASAPAPRPPSTTGSQMPPAVAPPPPSAAAAPSDTVARVATPPPPAVANAAANAPAAPSPAPASPKPVSAPAAPRARLCVECPPGESAAWGEVTIPGGAAVGCPTDLPARLRAIDPGAVAALAAEVAASGAGCRLVAVELPAGARFTGFRYEAQSAAVAADCLPGRDCPAGACRFPNDPVLRQVGNRTLLLVLFESTAPEERRAVVAGYSTYSKR